MPAPFTPSAIDTAYQWLCARRKDYCCHADVWFLRFYCRFMDDWVILSPTRWQLRKAIAKVNKSLQSLQLEQHPDKTFIGRISAGFDFLGYRFEAAGEGMLLRPARKTVRRCMRRGRMRRRLRPMSGNGMGECGLG